MPADSNLDNIPPSPIENDDLWLVNRFDRSYKVNSMQLGSYLIQVEVPKTCENDADCLVDQVCLDGLCQRVPCDEDGDCPTGFKCYNGYCYPDCNLHTDCGEGYVCVDPGVTGGDSICLPYPFPCNITELPGDGCPPDYTCWGDYCWHTCNGNDADCPPGMICVETQNNTNVGYICVPEGGGFPCADGVCPSGYECFFGMCFQECPITGDCEEGFTCVDINGTDYCVPYPFPCDLYADGCPDGMYCYQGDCYPKCDPNGGAGECADGFSCIDIGSGITICYPDLPDEKFVNDGPLVVRTEPTNGPAREKIIFTANQYGRSVLTFTGFDILPGGPGGGDCSNGQPCPPGYDCVGGLCVLLPCQDDSDCNHPDFNMVCSDGGFCFPTCTNDTNCPSGYDCVEGICLPGGVWPGGECSNGGTCPPGYECVGDICVPKQCINDGDCGTGFKCYGGYCYLLCGAEGGCPENHICVQIGPDESICMPIGGGPDGGGSGGDINIIIDPDWWDPDKNPNSPIGNGELNVSHSDYFKIDSTNGGSYSYFANQKGDTKPTLDINVDKWDPNKNSSSPIKNGRLRLNRGNGISFTNNPTDFYANQSNNTDLTISADMTYINNNVGDGQINVNAGNGISITGSNARANQTGNTTRVVTVNAKSNGGIVVDGNGVSVDWSKNPGGGGSTNPQPSGNVHSWAVIDMAGNFNNQGSPNTTIRKAFNVSHVTAIGTGRVYVHLRTPTGFVPAVCLVGAENSQIGNMGTDNGSGSTLLQNPTTSRVGTIIKGTNDEYYNPRWTHFLLVD